jgi:hypothetical protein
VPGLIPEPPSPDASKAERLRYARHWAILAGMVAIPVWIFVFVWVKSSAAVLAFVAVAVLTVINIASLTWRIARAERR